MADKLIITKARHVPSELPDSPFSIYVKIDAVFGKARAGFRFIDIDPDNIMHALRKYLVLLIREKYVDMIILDKNTEYIEGIPLVLFTVRKDIHMFKTVKKATMTERLITKYLGVDEPFNKIETQDKALASKCADAIIIASGHGGFSQEALKLSGTPVDLYKAGIIDAIGVEDWLATSEVIE